MNNPDHTPDFLDMTLRELLQEAPDFLDMTLRELLQEASIENGRGNPLAFKSIKADGRRVALVIATTDPKSIAIFESALCIKTIAEERL